MLILLVAVGLIVLGSWLLASHKEELPVTLPPLTRTLIYCGDCVGDGYWPTKTRLTISGQCSGCGGRSYVLAAKLAPMIQARTRREREIPEHSDITLQPLENEWQYEP